MTAKSFLVTFCAADERSPIKKDDCIVVSDEESSFTVFRDGKPVEAFTIDQSHSQWGCARSDDRTFWIEYTKSSRWTGDRTTLYGHMVDEQPQGNTNPPVGVWGADEQPPVGGNGDGNR